MSRYQRVSRCFCRVLLLAITGLGVATSPAAAQAPNPAPASPPQPAAGGLHLRVLRKGVGTPVNHAEIRLPGSDKQFTDKQGELSVLAPQGAGKLEVYRAGFETYSIDLSEVAGKNNLDIYLLPGVPDDNEVVVRGDKRPEASRKTVSVAEAVKVAPGGDPAQIPKLLPGVQSSTFSPQIVVRGSGPNDSLYLVDDFQVPFIFHLIGNISVMPDQLLSDVEFSTGGFGSQYGNATGGVVTLRTKSEVPERAQTELRINIPLYSSLYHEHPVNDGKDYVALSARRSYLELFLPAVLKKAGATDLTVVPSFGDEHAYYYHPTADGYVKVIGIHAYDGLHLITDADVSNTPDGKATFNLQNSFELAGVEWHRDLGQGWSMNIEPSISNQDAAITLIDNNIDIDVIAANVHIDAIKRLGGRDRLYLGTELGYGIANVSVLAPQPNSNDPFYDPLDAPKLHATEHLHVSNIAAWVATDQDIGDLTLTPGIRAFYFSQLKRTGYDPRLNWRYQLNKNNALKGAIGQYSEAPQYQDTDATFGNPNLKYIRSYHYVLGVETNWSERWMTDFQVFYKDIEDLVASDPVNIRNNSGTLLSAGFETFIRRNLTERLFGWLSYTYSKNVQRENPGEAYHRSQYDQTQVLNVAGNYKFTSVWDAGGRALYHTGDTFTGVDHAAYDTDLDKYQARQSPTQQLYNARQPPYYEFDLYGDRDYLFDTWKLTWRFGVEYLALQRQVQGVQYNYDYSKLNYFRGVPPIPYIEFRGVL